MHYFITGEQVGRINELLLGIPGHHHTKNEIYKILWSVLEQKMPSGTTELGTTGSAVGVPKVHMHIDEDEARLVYGSIKTANFEEGDSDDPEDEDNKLIARIRAEFPAIDKEIRERDRKNFIWGVLAEQDERVIKARRKLSNRLDLDSEEYRKIQDDFFRIKGIVDKELREKEGL